MSTNLHWFKSSYSGNEGECVEIAAPQTDPSSATPTTIHIRDSKTPTARTLQVTPATWSAFLPHAATYKGVVH
ncbi:DUF397 domain-containing protein [Streptomyces sp. CWNU-52B]|uniref:DUF397 domain-containing protein n=1 Tax=unclassified Streptomyces TaxID=2593676 RepID=UPI0039C34F2F